VYSYVNEYDNDLRRVWEIERPFELHLPAAIISGRADVILDTDDGEIRSLAIVDYKTSADPAADDDYALQLAIYADAGLREGLPIEAAYIHDLKAADRQPVDVSPAAIAASEQTVETTVADLRQRIFRPSPGPAAAAATSTACAAGTRARPPRRSSSGSHHQSRGAGQSVRAHLVDDASSEIEYVLDLRDVG
jgi:RecB family exonuclease